MHSLTSSFYPCFIGFDLGSEVMNLAESKLDSYVKRDNMHFVDFRNKGGIERNSSYDMFLDIIYQFLSNLGLLYANWVQLIPVGVNLTVI